MSKNQTSFQSRKFTLVINNPLPKGFTHEKIMNLLSSLATFTYCCMADEISTTGTPHTHIYVVYLNPKQFNTITKLFDGKAHVESSRGSSQSNRDYILKDGKWKDTKKHDTILEGTFEEFGTLPDDSHSLSSTPKFESEILDMIDSLIKEGNTPKQILSVGTFMYKYESIIKASYFDKRKAETPPLRDLTVHYHTSERAGDGKSYEYVKLCEKYGEENVYFMTDYANGGVGGLDSYSGEPVLFMDEFKSNLPYSLLLTLLDKYKSDVHCRYRNVSALWNEVHISSIMPVEELYKNIVNETDRQRDSIQQLLRRITYMVYHFRSADGKYQKFTLPASNYTGYGQLQRLAHEYYNEQLHPKSSSSNNNAIPDELKIFGDITVCDYNNRKD